MTEFDRTLTIVGHGFYVGRSYETPARLTDAAIVTRMGLRFSRLTGRLIGQATTHGGSWRLSEESRRAVGLSVHEVFLKRLPKLEPGLRFLAEHGD